MMVATTSPPPQLIADPSPEEIIWDVMAEPDIEDVIIEDDKPVDNWISEKQQRLLTTSAYSSFNFDFPFILTANVGLFYADKQPPLVPDIMLSLRVKCPEDWTQKKNRSYFVWNMRKAPDVVIEIVSNTIGNELGSKPNDYLTAGVGYYVVFDPFRYLSPDRLRVYERRGMSYHLKPNYLLEEINLGLTLWTGEFEGSSYDHWLRWCDPSGNIFLTGDEKFELEKQRAETERQRAESEKQRAEAEKQRAEAEKQRAEAERQRADRLSQLLREQGIDPDSV
jgi:Uma2 family endonuclease